jgi:hypothetical protein
MNGLEFLYHVLFVEKDIGLWSIITIGIIITLVTIICEYGANASDGHM